MKGQREGKFQEMKLSIPVFTAHLGRWRELMDDKMRNLIIAQY